MPEEVSSQLHAPAVWLGFGGEKAAGIQGLPCVSLQPPPRLAFQKVPSELSFDRLGRQFPPQSHTKLYWISSMRMFPVSYAPELGRIGVVVGGMMSAFGRPREHPRLYRLSFSRCNASGSRIFPKLTVSWRCS
jgi:hypothetical protein